VADKPSYEVIEALLAPTTRLERRVEIYENDGLTPWRADLWDRLIPEGSSVNVEFERDEKWACDFSFDNTDGELDHKPDGLWYDKVFKPFIGVYVDSRERQPVIMIADANGLTDEEIAQIRNLIVAAGFTNVQVNTTATSFIEVADADIVVFAFAAVNSKDALMASCFERGKAVLTLSSYGDHLETPYLFSGSTDGIVGTPSTRFDPNPAVAHPVTAGWQRWNSSQVAAAARKLTPKAGVVTVGHSPDLYTSGTGGIYAYEKLGVRWVHAQFSDWSSFLDYTYGDGSVLTAAQSESNFVDFLSSALEWMDTYEPEPYWECQLGEYQPDLVVRGEDGYTTSVSGRDYAKRAMGSKLANASTFSAGTNIRSIITAVATNAGISKQNVQPMPENLAIDMTFEADTERWKIIKDICTAFNYEVYFNHQGYMTVRPYRDPLLTPPTLELTSGEWGNLVSRGERASDARLFNHVIVRGESNDQTVPPVAAEAKNINPASPTSIQRIGDRVHTISSGAVTTVPQAQALADSYLRVSSLEEFELSFTAIMFPWIEAGDILEIEELRANQFWPTRYLVSSLNFPMDLSPMTGSGKRVTIVL
jgi:hypothetical protein